MFFDSKIDPFFHCIKGYTELGLFLWDSVGFLLEYRDSVDFSWEITSKLGNFLIYAIIIRW